MNDDKQTNKPLANATIEFAHVLRQEHELIIDTLKQIDALLKDAFQRLSWSITAIDDLELPEDFANVTKMANVHYAQTNSKTFMQVLQILSTVTKQFYTQVNTTIQALQAEDMITQLITTLIKSHQTIYEFSEELIILNQQLLNDECNQEDVAQQLQSIAEKFQQHKSILLSKPVMTRTLDSNDSEIFE